MRATRLASALLATLALACATPAQPVVVPSAIVLRDPNGHDERVLEQAARAPFYVLFFFSADCPVQKAHDERIRQIVEKYDRVAFGAVVSDIGADIAVERAAAADRRLGVPVFEDRGAALADALGVEYSTHTVVLDRAGRVLYSGGIDSDRTYLSLNAERWLERALDAALAGRPIEKAKTEPLGCPLRKH